MWTIPDESKNSSSITLSFDLTCHRFFFLGNDGDFQVADCRFSCGSYRKHHILSHVMIWLRNVPSLSALSIRSPQMLMQSSRWSCVETRGALCWVTRDTFRSSDRILWQVPWLIPAAAAILSTVWEQLAHTNVATSWILS
jgi:hypothetical protein